MLNFDNFDTWVILCICSACNNIFFSVWDKSRVKWDNSRNSTQKMRTIMSLQIAYHLNNTLGVERHSTKYKQMLEPLQNTVLTKKLPTNFFLVGPRHTTYSWNVKWPEKDACYIAQPIQPNLDENGLDWLCYSAGNFQTAPMIFFIFSGYFFWMISLRTYKPEIPAHFCHLIFQL